MKPLNITLIALTAALSLPVSADVSVTDTNTAVFNFGGTIEPMCKVKGNDNGQASTLNLAQNNTTQDIGTLEVWCNTGRNATTDYASANNGYLVSGSNRIAYTLDVGDNVQNVDLSSGFTNANTEAGSDNTGSGKSQTLKITPQANGLEDAGQYSDTITVTVAYN